MPERINQSAVEMSQKNDSEYLSKRIFSRRNIYLVIILDLFEKLTVYERFASYFHIRMSNFSMAQSVLL